MVITSDISRIFLTTLCGRDAIGLKGPGECSCAATMLSSVSATLLGPMLAECTGRLADRTAKASMSSPLATTGLGEKAGSEAIADGRSSEPSEAWPARVGSEPVCPSLLNLGRVHLLTHEGGQVTVLP